MACGMLDESAEGVRLRERVRAEGPAAMAGLFADHRNRLRRMVEMRLDHRVRARVDPSDVLQEAYIDAANRLEAYLQKPDMPLFLWLRLVVGERLLKVHRHHLGTQMREVGRELTLFHGALPAASSAAIAAHLLGKVTSPTQAAVRAERMLRLQEALNALDPVDREIVSLRHFEELTHVEAARALDIEPGAAAMRYFRALKHLKDMLADMTSAGKE